MLKKTPRRTGFPRFPDCAERISGMDNTMPNPPRTGGADAAWLENENLHNYHWPSQSFFPAKRSVFGKSHPIPAIHSPQFHKGSMKSTLSLQTRFKTS